MANGTPESECVLVVSSSSDDSPSWLVYIEDERSPRSVESFTDIGRARRHAAELAKQLGLRAFEFVGPRRIPIDDSSIPSEWIWAEVHHATGMEPIAIDPSTRERKTGPNGETIFLYRGYSRPRRGDHSHYRGWYALNYSVTLNREITGGERLQAVQDAAPSHRDVKADVHRELFDKICQAYGMTNPATEQPG